MQVDTMFLYGKGLLHMFHVATHFCGGKFRMCQSANDISRPIPQMWTLVYIGAPGDLSVDQGSSCVCGQMRSDLAAKRVMLLQAPVENLGKICFLDRYQAPILAAYTKIRSYLPQHTSEQEYLTMAVHAVHSTVIAESLCPILLVFGAITRPARTVTSPTQLQRATSINAAMVDVAKEQ